MLQTMKDLVIEMALQLTNHQRSNVLFTPPTDLPYQGSFFHHPYPPQPTPHSPLTHISPHTSHLHTPPFNIPQQSTQGITPQLN